MSKIPQIAFIYIEPDVAYIKRDTCWIQFSLADGDADVGNSDTSQVWLRDSRYPTSGFQNEAFPDINPAVENPKKGIQGVCTFYPKPQPVPRTDSLHSSPSGDTISYEIYITDRAGNVSNHIFTRPIIIKN